MGRKGGGLTPSTPGSGQVRHDEDRSDNMIQLSEEAPGNVAPISANWGQRGLQISAAITMRVSHAGRIGECCVR
jgi:hypothetical protein